MSNRKPCGRKLGRDTADLQLPDRTERRQPPAPGYPLARVGLRSGHRPTPERLRGWGNTPGNAHIRVAISGTILTPDRRLHRL